MQRSANLFCFRPRLIDMLTHKAFGVLLVHRTLNCYAKRNWQKKLSSYF